MLSIRFLVNYSGRIVCHPFACFLFRRFLCARIFFPWKKLVNEETLCADHIRIQTKWMRTLLRCVCGQVIAEWVRMVCMLVFVTTHEHTCALHEHDELCKPRENDTVEKKWRLAFEVYKHFTAAHCSLASASMYDCVMRCFRAMSKEKEIVNCTPTSTRQPTKAHMCSHTQDTTQWTWTWGSLLVHNGKACTFNRIIIGLQEQVVQYHTTYEVCFGIVRFCNPNTITVDVRADSHTHTIVAVTPVHCIANGMQNFANSMATFNANIILSSHNVRCNLIWQMVIELTAPQSNRFLWEETIAGKLILFYIFFIFLSILQFFHDFSLLFIWLCVCVFM